MEKIYSAATEAEVQVEQSSSFNCQEAQKPQLPNRKEKKAWLDFGFENSEPK